MFANRNPPRVAPATPSSVCTFGGHIASLGMRLLCLVFSAARPAAPGAAPFPPTGAAAAHAAAAAVTTAGLTP